MNKKIIINGDFLCRNLTGIERFAFETCKQLDEIVPKDSIWIFIPKNAKNIPDFKNITICKSRKVLKSFPLWQHFVYSHFLTSNNAIGLDFSNTCPIFHAGFVFLHDIYFKMYPEDFTSKRSKLIKIYSCFLYRYIAKHAKHVFTVSNFSKKQIMEIYGTKENRISVIPNGWDHFKTVSEDESILSRFPDLQKNQFYFTLGSLAKRKNLKWIASYAQKHQDETFAISGKGISGLVPDELKVLQTLPNVILLGYVTDEEVKTLMKNCKAFLFPSYYEGFGIPPLEALSCGTKIIVSNAASLPEIYGNSAHYIDPENTNCNLSALLTEQVESPEKVLEKYTYKNAAELLWKSLQENNK